MADAPPPVEPWQWPDAQWRHARRPRAAPAAASGPRTGWATRGAPSRSRSTPTTTRTSSRDGGQLDRPALPGDSTAIASGCPDPEAARPVRRSPPRSTSRPSPRSSTPTSSAASSPRATRSASTAGSTSSTRRSRTTPERDLMLRSADTLGADRRRAPVGLRTPSWDFSPTRSAIEKEMGLALRLVAHGRRGLLRAAARRRAHRRDRAARRVGARRRRRTS